MHISGKVFFSVDELVYAFLSFLFNVVGAHHYISRDRVPPQRSQLLLHALLDELELSNTYAYKIPLALFSETASLMGAACSYFFLPSCEGS